MCIAPKIEFALSPLCPTLAEKSTFQQKYSVLALIYVIGYIIFYKFKIGFSFCLPLLAFL